MTTRLKLLTVAAILLALAPAGCLPYDSAATPTPAHVTVQIDDLPLVLNDATCTWLEGDGQLIIEAGDAARVAYILLAAPIDWVGAALPEGPGAEPELELTVNGTPLSIDEATLDGAMNSEQTNGTFLGRLADGSPISGEWTCPEVLEG